MGLVVTGADVALFMWVLQCYTYIPLKKYMKVSDKSQA